MALLREGFLSILCFSLLSYCCFKHSQDDAWSWDHHLVSCWATEPTSNHLLPHLLLYKTNTPTQSYTAVNWVLTTPNWHSTRWSNINLLHYLRIIGAEKGHLRWNHTKQQHQHQSIGIQCSIRILSWKMRLKLVKII